ncbi:hypothetical protein A946_10920 [Methylacidiphilum kamchatkense Kam1]|uniref:Uncharacterized protein n=1 Tax=Methylacidiphilum kamchatkense Kam1 TaxID=1202785 RepID=A0ABR4ZUJ7_9BACT|nr:hypothetical protein [Methylacidiphilum kamchatkense]KIE57824.1 hypothetical protein A946_10920 [Methylacidiphilum kamchatkense Kam1]
MKDSFPQNQEHGILGPVSQILGVLRLWSCELSHGLVRFTRAKLAVALRVKALGRVALSAELHRPIRTRF